MIKEDTIFKLNQLKLTYYYMDEKDGFYGSPISTSVEIKYEDNKLIKEIKHVFYGGEDKYIEEANSELLNELSKIDLRKLNNNYYTDNSPENLSHWEINYNNIFYIVGTFNQLVLEFTTLSRLLDFNNIRKKELSKERIEDTISESGEEVWN